MKRRDVISAAAAIATGTATVAILGGHSKKETSKGQNASPNRSELGAPMISKNRREFRLATTWPKDFPGLGQMPKNIAKAVYEMSDGRLDIKVYAAGELVGALESFDAVSSGAADMYHGAEYYWQGKSKGFSFFTAVPMGMTAAEIMGWIDFGGGQALWDDLSAKFNIKALQAGNTGHQAGGWYKKEMNTLEDFKGLKIRMPGLAGEVIRRLGGAAVKLSGGEIYQSLQSGAIDATEWVGPWNDLAFGFYREAPYYYMPGFHEPGASLACGVNLDVWNSLSVADQAILKYACKSVNDISLGEYTYQNAIAMETLRRDHGISPRLFSDEIMLEIGKISLDVVRDLGTSDPVTKRIFESFDTNLRRSRDWTQLGDGAYIRARKLAMDR